MCKTGRVPGHHARMDIIPAEKLAPVVKEDFIIIVVVMEERYFQRTRIGFEGAWRKSANDKAVCDKGGMRRWWQVVAVAHQGPDVSPVEPYRSQVTLPSDRIERVKGIDDLAQATLAFDPYLPLVFVLLGEKGLVNGGRIEHWVSKDQGNSWSLRRDITPDAAQYPGWAFNNVQPVVRPDGSIVDDMLIFYGWLDATNPDGVAFLLDET